MNGPGLSFCSGLRRFAGLRAASAVAFLGLAAVSASAAQRYSPFDLSALGIYSKALNNHGGIASHTSSAWAYWDGGQRRLYPLPQDVSGGFPLKVNDLAQIAGVWDGDSGRQGALYWDGENFIDLTALVSGVGGASTAINNRGEVAFHTSIHGRSRGFLLSGSVVTDLGDLRSSDLTVDDMNSATEVVGDALLDDGRYRAFVWHNGTMRDLGTFGGNSSFGVAINDAGMVVGEADCAGTPSIRRAFIHSAGRMVDLGVLGTGTRSRVDDINAWGVVVGYTETVPGAALRWYIWRGGVMQDLGMLVDLDDGVFPEVYTDAINDVGQILGRAAFAGGVRQALLNPLPLTGEPTRLVNVSVRAGTHSGEGTSIAGFVLSGGTVSASVLARVVGPALRPYGVTAAAGDPRLDLFKEGVRDPIGGNDDWSTAADPASVTGAAQRVGAFALPSGSADAALLADLTSGVYTVHATAATVSDGGVALSEVYDAATDPAAARLTNASMRVWVGGGEETAIVGFVLQGDNPAKVLIRAVGPGLAPFGVAQRLADPVLFLHREGAPVFGNDNWGSREGFPLLAQVSDSAGAFALTDGSTDAALIAELEPGHYTVHVNGANGGSGVALVEVYLLPGS